MKFINLVLAVGLLVFSFQSLSAEKTENEKLIAIQKVEIIDKPALMVGMAKTYRMSDDYYIGAMYLDQNVQFDKSVEFLLVDVARRMEFKFVSKDSVSARSFKRKLAESMRINNSRKTVQAEKDNLVKFMRLFDGEYKKGDVIAFDYHSNFGTRIKLNGRILGEISNSTNLYNMLVNMWVGKRPPTSKFKEGILGNNENDYAIALLREYASL